MGGQQELCVFLLRGSRVRLGLQGTDPHSCTSKPIFNLNSFIAFHSGLSDQTGLWIIQYSYGQMCGSDYHFSSETFDYCPVLLHVDISRYACLYALKTNKNFVTQEEIGLFIVGKNHGRASARGHHQDRTNCQFETSGDAQTPTST